MTVIASLALTCDAGLGTASLSASVGKDIYAGIQASSESRVSMLSVLVQGLA